MAYRQSVGECQRDLFGGLEPHRAIPTLTVPIRARVHQIDYEPEADAGVVAQERKKWPLTRARWKEVVAKCVIDSEHRIDVMNPARVPFISDVSFVAKKMFEGDFDDEVRHVPTRRLAV